MRAHAAIGHAARLGLAGLAGAVALAGCGGGVDSGGLSAGDRKAAQAAMDGLQGSNITTQLVSLSTTAGRVPAACRVHLESRDPLTFKVYVFWIPFIGPQAYTWLQMTLTKNVSEDRFHLGTAEAVSPSGVQLANGEIVAPSASNYDPLSMGGKRQEQRNRRALKAHAGDVFSKPGANCQVLMNGYLRLVPNP